MQSTSFIRRTRRGRVMKVVREKYLRDDIPCGMDGCPLCFRVSRVFVGKKRGITTVGDDLNDDGTGTASPDADRCVIREPMIVTVSNGAKTGNLETTTVPHIIVPDTNILRHQLDFLENKEVFHDVVILQTVLDEVRHLSYAIYQRARRMVDDPERRFYVLCNEHHRETAVDKLANETPNDRNDRAIRHAAQWLGYHFSKLPKTDEKDITRSITNETKVILLSDDYANRQRAHVEGLLAFSAKEYANTISDKFPNIIDLVAASSDGTDGTSASTGNSDFMYKNHLSANDIMLGITAGTFRQGTINISLHNNLEGTMLIKLNGEDCQVTISGREDLNRAIHGDTVAIKLKPKSQWISGLDSSSLVDEDTSDSDEDTTKKIQKPKKKVTPIDPSLLRPTAEVVGIITRHWRPYCGTIDRDSVKPVSGNQTLQSVFFWSIDKRIPKIRIRTRQADYLLGQRIMVAIDSWPKDSKYPHGHFVRTLGEIGDKETETEVLLLENDVPYAPFSKQVLSFLPKEGEQWVVKDEHLEGRMDLRHLDVCSIDPPKCTDIDDALHCRPLPNGNFEVGVHIADVSHFVKPGNSMDLEARRRSTTVYLVNKRIDMLPPLLGTNLCSLHCNVDRLAFSVIWEITKDADIVSTKFTKSVIRSRSAFEYSEAQAVLDDKNAVDPLSISIKTLNMLAKKLSASRMEAGALTLSSPEVKFTFENDQHDPLDVEMKQLQEANKLVEEFMLLANIAVAKKIYEHFPETAVLRRHPTPLQESFERLNAALEDIGLAKLDTSTSKTLADSLDKAVVPENPYLNNLFRMMTTRCMMQAVYFCSGTVPYKDFWHYGLACEIYTHFTSPIRRYADLMVHRLLALAIGYEHHNVGELTSKDAIKDITDVLNFRNRSAQQAARASVELFTGLLFKDTVVVETAYVVRVLKNGLGVLIPKYGIDGFIHLDEQTAAGIAAKAEHERVSKRMKTSTTSSQKNVPPVPQISYEFEESTNHMIFGKEKKVVKVFSKVEVQISVAEVGATAAARSKVQMRLFKY